MKLICSRHGISDFYKSSGIKDKWKCKKCDYLYTRKYFNNLKEKAIEYAGGKCSECNYNKCRRALHFHHINPEDKEAGIFESRSGYKKIRNWEKLKVEIDKCILLCSNCHMELHDKDEKIYYEEIDFKLSLSDIEYLNKCIHKDILTPEQAMEKAITIIKNRLPKLNVSELRYQLWMDENIFNKITNKDQ